MQPPIRLIVGLGNPGPQYEQTRHNAGAWFVEQLLLNQHATLCRESKFLGRYAKVIIHGHECHLLIPSTFMNLSGQSVKAVMNFFKLPESSLLVIHDELDLACGTIRLKLGGGHGGHNGLRDIIAHLNTPEFHRLRIGIGHPGHRDEVTNYVLDKPSKAEKEQITDSINQALTLIPEMLDGQTQRAMQQLHTANLGKVGMPNRRKIWA